MILNHAMQPSLNRAERRAAVRYPCRTDDACLLQVSHRRAARWARPEDISTTGIGLAVSGPFTAGTLALVQFSHRHEGPPLSLVAQVIHICPRSDGAWATGCRYDSPRGDLGAEEREQISVYFRQPGPAGGVRLPLPATLVDKLQSPLPPLLQALKRHPASAPETEPSWGTEPEARELGLEQLFDVQLIARRKLRLHLEVVELEGLLIRALETASVPAARLGRRCTLLCPQESVFAEVDSARMQWVCSTLIAEVARQCGREGSLWLAAEKEESMGLLRIGGPDAPMDPGPLPACADVLVALESGDEACRRARVRLALVRGLVELHGGNIECRPARTGSGMEFVVRLPLHPNLSH